MVIIAKQNAFSVIIGKTATAIHKGIAVTTETIFRFQECSSFFCVPLLLIQRINTNFSAFKIRACPQHPVDFILRNYKSGGLFALRFSGCILCRRINFLNLLCFGLKQAHKVQLLISSVRMTSSACAFSMFMCCTQAIWFNFLSGAGFAFRSSAIICSIRAVAVS